MSKIIESFHRSIILTFFFGIITVVLHYFDNALIKKLIANRIRESIAEHVMEYDGQTVHRCKYHILVVRHNAIGSKTSVIINSPLNLINY
jgi:hypothetical protein